MLRTLELQLQLQAIFDSIEFIVRRTPSEMLLKYNFDSQCVTLVTNLSSLHLEITLISI